MDVEKEFEKVLGEKVEVAAAAASAAAAAAREDGSSHGRATGSEEDAPKGEDDPVRARALPQASKEERETRELTHTPYRAWRRRCVRARGRNVPH
jgi:hypothetical protein